MIVYSDVVGSAFNAVSNILNGLSFFLGLLYLYLFYTFLLDDAPQLSSAQLNLNGYCNYSLALMIISRAHRHIYIVMISSQCHLYVND